MDGRDFCFPNGYYVRVYDDRLVYRRHCVNGYTTENPCIIIYVLHKLRVKIIIQRLDTGIMVAYTGKHKGTFKVPENTKIGEIIKIALSSALDKPVTIESEFKATLF